MSWINKILPSISTTSIGSKSKSSVPEGIWKKCPRCDATLYRGDLERNGEVCPKCNHHLRITARRRIELFLDTERQEELFSDIEPVDILKFRDLKKYRDRLSAAQKNTGEKDALVVASGSVDSTELVVAAFEFGFIGGSMGAVVGEKFVQAVNVCVARELPLVCFSTSGGARMQEALVSLMQMAKTAAALARLRRHRLPFISVLVDPVYGGVSASLAIMGDINIAEPNALVGFTGPDVIRQTVRVKLPDGFQRSEFLLEHGAIDMIVHRKQLRERIVSLIRKLMFDRHSAPEPDLGENEESEAAADLEATEAAPETMEAAPESAADGSGNGSGEGQEAPDEIETKVDPGAATEQSAESSQNPHSELQEAGGDTETEQQSEHGNESAPGGEGAAGSGSDEQAQHGDGDSSDKSADK